MEENSQDSAQPGRRRIMSTNRDTTNAAPEPQVRMEIVEQAVLNLQRVGVMVQIANLPNSRVAIVINGYFCSVCHHLSASTVCQYCASTGKSASTPAVETGAVLAHRAVDQQ